MSIGSRPEYREVENFTENSICRLVQDTQAGIQRAVRSHFLGKNKQTVMIYVH